MSTTMQDDARRPGLCTGWLPILSAVTFALAGCVADAPAASEGEAESPLTVLLADTEAREILAAYDDGEVFLELHARVEAGEVLSEIRDREGRLLTELHLPDVEVADEGTFAGLQHSIDHSREHLAEAFPEGVPDSVRHAYGALGNELWYATGDFGESALHYGTSWHSAVLRGTTSERPYTSSDVCPEVYEDSSIPWHTEAEHEDTSSSTTRELSLEEQQLGYWTCDTEFCHGCCGGGWRVGQTCWYAIACYLHDLACTRCGSWACGWQCQPDVY